MPTSAIDSAVFRHIFGTEQMRKVWSDENRTQRYLDIEAALARELGLAPPEIAWHTQRDRIAEAGCFLGLLTGTLAKFATDVKLLMQTKAGRGGSRIRPGAALPPTIPQKRNPI